MNKEEAVRAQTELKAKGLYTGNIDGLWGPLSQAAWEKATAATKAALASEKVIWGAKVSKAFINKIKAISKELGLGPDGPNELMACIAWESGMSFKPNVVNRAGSGATGLIQFMPKTAIGLGTTTKLLAAMTAERQLDYVLRYFLPYKGKMHNLGDIYMSILWPRGVGKPDTYVLWDRASSPRTFRQNSGLDLDNDGAISRAECLTKIRGMYNLGKEYAA